MNRTIWQHYESQDPTQPALVTIISENFTPPEGVEYTADENGYVIWHQEHDGLGQCVTRDMSSLLHQSMSEDTMAVLLGSLYSDLLRLTKALNIISVDTPASCFTKQTRVINPMNREVA
jgi:hypothetical protein